ncbi:hypothetical protein COU54_00465 [Candidatus Pacearchaeota archaeon CG10_big_fil_rev_8_21_14_0_10_31_24]|nr:MAG: hypothetical protein COU54_00465 [Candidatus Pacearchaeota archaeon CG10_big_fil_rev_8_21_14_0_10_31_24]
MENLKPENYKEFKEKFNYNDPNYAFYYKFIKRPISYPLTWWVFKNTNYTPNQLTLMGVVIVLLSALFFSIGTYVMVIFGAILFFVFEIFDDFDGVIARGKGLTSKRGAWFDTMGGIFGKVIVMFGISIGLYNSLEESKYLILGLIAIAAYTLANILDMSIKIYFTNKKHKKLKFAEHKPDPKTLGGKLSILSESIMNLWYVLLILGGLTNMLYLFIWFAAIYYSIYTVSQFIYRSRFYRNQ